MRRNGYRREDENHAKETVEEMVKKIIDLLFPNGMPEEVSTEDITPLDIDTAPHPYGWGDDVFTELLSTIGVNIYAQSYKLEIEPFLARIFEKYGDDVDTENGRAVNSWGNQEITITVYNPDYSNKENDTMYRKLHAAW